MSRPASRLLLAVLSLAALGSVSRPARAGDPQEQQLAQALFDEGRRLMDQKRYAEACPKLAESQRLDPGGGTLLNLAICHEKEGKLATAKSDYEEALAVATRDGRRDRQAIARERLAAGEAAVPRIVVVVASGADPAGLEVKLDGLALRRAAWGVATPVDPGAHVVEANAPGRAPWSSQVTIQASQRKVVDVPALGPLAVLPEGEVVGGLAMPAPSAQGAAPRLDDGAAPADPPATDVFTPGHANPLFYTALTVTLAAGTTSLVTGVLAFVARQDAKTGCLPDRQYCRDQATIDAADRSATLAWVSTVTLGVAALGAVGMIVLPSRTRSDRASVRAAALPGGASLGLSGTF